MIFVLIHTSIQIYDVQQLKLPINLGYFAQNLGITNTLPAKLISVMLAIEITNKRG
jgi:hypothetical protein